MPLYPFVEGKVGQSHKFQQGKNARDKETKLELIYSLRPIGLYTVSFLGRPTNCIHTKNSKYL